jgi:hypothetical protein
MPSPIERIDDTDSNALLVDDQVAIASDDQGFLVVARQYSFVGTAILAWRVDASGAVLDFAKLREAPSVAEPTVAWTGEAYLVAWQEGVASADVDYDIIGVYIHPDAGAGTPFMIAGGPGGQLEPHAAHGAGHTVVVWRDSTNGGRKVRGALLDPDGVIAIRDISTTAGSVPAVVHSQDGHAFLVAWQGSPDGAPDDILGSWVSDDAGRWADAAGQPVFDPVPVVLASVPRPELAPALASEADGRMLLAYQRFVDTPTLSVRVHGKLVASGILDGAACSDDSDCASRACEDGVCCAQSCGSCQQCEAGTGACVAVTGVEDDSCFGPERCDASGSCKASEGQPCSDAAECASGFCVEGTCCNSACDASCEQCNAPLGTCTVRDCGGYSCEDRMCRDSCRSSLDCAEGYQCVGDGTCQLPTSSDVTGECTATGRVRARGIHGIALMLVCALLFERRRRRAA